MYTHDKYTRNDNPTLAHSDNHTQHLHTLDSTIKLAVQCDLINKQGPTAAHGHGWQTTDLTLAELKKHIQSGFAFCTAALTSEHRKTDNFQSAWGILIDLDEHSLTEAQNDSFLRTIATFGFTTPSHSEQTPHSKIGCLFDKPVTDPVLFRRYVEAVMHRIKTVKADPSGKDATRFSYGNTDAQWAFYGNGLCVDTLNQWLADDAIQNHPAITPEQVLNDTGKLYSGTTLIKFRQDNIWHDMNARRIMGSLGVTTFNATGYSNPVHCPCPHHNNNDEKPSAAWHRDKYHLHCFTSGKNYGIIQTASMLGIDITDTGKAHRGLWNSTRDFFLSHTIKNENGNKIQPFESFSRFLDAMTMYGVQPGWYSIAELDAALNGLFSDRTLRYSIASNLFSSKDLPHDGGLFCSVVLVIKRKDISYNHADIDAKNSISIPPLTPEQRSTGNGRPKTYYFVPTEQELMRALGIDRGIYHDWLTFADIQSNSAYTKAINRVLIEQRPGKYSQKFLSNRIGKTTRTIRRYISKDSNLKTRQNERILGTVTDEERLPVKPIGRRWLVMAHTKTGEMIRYKYCRSTYQYLSQFEQPIYAVERVASSYWSTRGKPLQDKTQLEQIA